MTRLAEMTPVSLANGSVIKFRKCETAFAPTVTRSLSHRAKRGVPHLLSQNGI